MLMSYVIFTCHTIIIIISKFIKCHVCLQKAAEVLFTYIIFML